MTAVNDSASLGNQGASWRHQITIIDTLHIGSGTTIDMRLLLQSCCLYHLKCDTVTQNAHTFDYLAFVVSQTLPCQT